MAQDISKMETTAVEWFRKQLIKRDFDKTIAELYEQAKAMEKEQIINFGNDLLAQNDRSYIGFPDLAKEYYNETYNK